MPPKRPSTRAKSADGKEVLKRILAAPTMPAALLVTIPDTIRRQRLERLLVDKLREAGPISTRVVHGKTLTTQAVVALKDELASLSLFTPRQCFIVREVEEIAAKPLELLRDALQAVPEGSYVVLFAGSLPATNLILKALAAKELVCAFGELEGAELRRWLERDLKDSGVLDWEDGIIEALLESAQLNAQSANTHTPDVLHQMVERIALYLDGPRLTHADLNGVFLEQVSVNDFELLDAVRGGARLKAQLLLQRAFRAGRSPFMLLALFNRNFTQQLAVRAMLDGRAAPQEIRTQLNIQPWLFDKILAGVKRYSLEKLHHTIREVLRADSRLKNHALEPENIFSGLVEDLSPS